MGFDIVLLQAYGARSPKFRSIRGEAMSHKKHERHKELDRRRKRKKERLRQRIRDAKAAAKA